MAHFRARIDNAGAQLIALREITTMGNSLYVVHTDHLGSVSAVTCGNSGGCPGGFVIRAVVGRQYYRPYGGPRGDTVALPTDRAFTGQYRDATGLDYFRARYFSSSLGRFISADSIVPGAGNPQNLNRYAYVRNSPVSLVDPTGHFAQCDTKGNCYDDGYSISNPGFTSSDPDERRKRLLAYNNDLVGWADKGWVTDLAALAELVDFAASMIPVKFAGNRTKAFVDDLTSVLTEVNGRTYYDHAELLGQSGFDWIFQDPVTGGKQPHHLWAYVAYASKFGPAPAALGNLAHETFLGQRSSDGYLRGRSFQDYALGTEGVILGVKLGDGSVGVADAGNYVRNNFGPGGDAALVWRRDPVNKLFYASALSVAAVTIAPIPSGQQGGR